MSSWRHVQALWLKNKKDKVDVNLRLRNDYKQSVTIKFNEILLEHAGERGNLLHPSGGMLELTSGETQERVFIFRFFSGKLRSAPAKLTIKVSEGPMENYGKKMLQPLVLDLPADTK